MQDRWDVLAVGNAIVDIFARADDDFLAAHDVARGRMTLAERDEAVALTGAIGKGEEEAGGSAANTAVGVASLGGRAAFVGKCADDRLGGAFRSSLAAAGVAHETPPGPSEPPTGRSVVLVTPDHERSMVTYPGAAATLGADDIDPGIVTAARIVLVEGYLFYAPSCVEALRAVGEAARAAGRALALALSDPLCVEVNREAMRAFVDDGIDILIANEDEAKAFYGAGGFDEALARARDDVPTAVVTRSEKGATIARGGEAVEVPAHPVDPEVVDVTGAGDAFAAGTLFALARGRSCREAARLGAICASEVISHFGARPETDLARLAAAEGIR